MIVRCSDLAQIALEARRLGEILITPCPCDRHNCTLGEHVWTTTSQAHPAPILGTSTDGLCRRCYGARRTTGSLPPKTILQAWRDGTRITDRVLAAAIAEAKQGKAKGKGKRRKAG